ncbi:putative Ig domain-containing protein [Spirosoma soli]|uniref:Ig domain-containing protein n=1 Tax=Spirosoma soli TaxID=1770529 RepID=A0ABW5M1N2_9BACT
MRIFLFLLISWLRQLLSFLIGSKPVTSLPFRTPLSVWHRLLYAKLAVKHRIYLAGMTLVLFLPFGAKAQLISINAPGPVCAGQSVNVSVLAGTLPLNAVNLQVSSPSGLTSTVGSGNSLITVNTSPTLTTGVRNLTVTASPLGVGLPLTLQVPITVTGLPVLTPQIPTTATAGSVLNLASCTSGTVSYTLAGGTTGIGPLTLTPALAGQSITVACSDGPCSSAPTTLNLPTLNAGLGLQAPGSVCVGAPVSLTLLPTNLDLGQAGLTITASTPTGALDVNVLNGGVIAISGGNLTVGLNSVTVTASLAGVPLASATTNLNVLELPTAPSSPGTLTATVGSVLSVTGLCPTGTTLTVPGNLVGLGTIPVSTSAAGLQSLTVLCTNGTCLSLPTIVNVDVLNPVVASLALQAPGSVCVGAPASLTLLPTNLDLGQAGLAITASTPTGALDVNVLNGGVIAISGGNLTVGLNSVTVTASLAGVPLASATTNLNVLELPTAPSSPGTLTATVGSVLSVSGLCPTGTTLTVPGNLVGLGTIPVSTSAAGLQSLTVLCTNGTCLSLPTIVNVDVLNPVVASLALQAPGSVCVGAPVSLTLLPTNLDLGQAGLTITASTPSGALDVNVLNGGVIAISGGNLTVGLNSVTVTASLAGVPLASATTNLNVLDLPTAPSSPGTLTATVGSVLSVSGLCPTGTTLTVPGNLVGLGTIPVSTSAAGLQSLTVLCTNGTCLSLPTIVNVDVLNPVVASLALQAPGSVCVGAPASLTLLPTNLDLGQAGLTITASTPTGALDVNVLNGGVIAISGGNLTVGLNSVTVTASLAGVPLASATTNLNVLELPTAPSSPGTLTATVGSVLSVSGLCPTGTTLTVPGNLVGLGTIPVSTSAAGLQSLTVLCTNGTCLSLPTIVNVDVLNPVVASLALQAPGSVCVGAPVSLTLLPTNLDLGQAGLTITASTPSGTLTVGALSSNGVVSVSGGNLTVGDDVPISVSVSLGGVPLASTTATLDVLAQPEAPSQPGTLTATIGSVLSVTGLCPAGTLVNLTNLGDLSGIVSVSVTSADVQSLTVLCNNGGCLSLPTIIDLDVNAVTPIFSVSAAASICFGQPLSLTVLPSNFGINDGVVSLSITGPVGIDVSAINDEGVATINGLPAGNQNLTVTAFVAGQPVASVQVPVSVANVQPPVVVTASGQTYPAGQTSLSVVQNSGDVLFNASCSTGTVSYTGSNGAIGNGDITVATSATGVFSFSAVCTQGGCVSPATVVSLTVVAPVPNQAPVLSQSLTSPINGTVGVGVSIPTAYAFSDPEGGPLSFSSPNLPASLSIDAGTGLITGAPSTSGTFGITVVVSDPQSLTASGSFDLIVVPAAVPNQAPVLSQSLTSPINGTVGVGVSIPTAYAFSDPEGGPLSFSSPNLPASLSIDAGTGLITGAPSTSGTFGITVVVSDPQSLTASGSFDLIVVPAAVPNQAPVLSQSLTSPINGTVGVGVSIPTAYAFSDPEGGPLSFSSPNLPASLSIDAGTGLITGAPSTSGTFGITVVVSDPQSLTASGSFDLIVVPAAVPNQAPVLSQSLTSPINGTVGVGVSIPTAYAFSDPEGGPLSFSSPNLPASLSIDAGTGLITGAPSTSGTFGITVVASDPQSLTASGSFDLIVVPAAVPNQAPVLSQSLTSPINATVGVGVSIPTAYAFSDPEGGPLSFSSPNLPASLSIDAGTGLITGAPSTSGTFGITVVVSDPQSLTASGSFDLIVVPAAVPNQAPVLSQSLTSPINGTVGVGVSIPTAYAFSDPEGGPLSFSSPNLPASLSIDAGTGVITGAPSTSGTFGITVVASDPQSLTASGSFDLIVVPAAVPNQAPVLSQSLTSPINGTVGVGVSIPTAYAFSDPEGGPLSFSSPNLPASLSIDAGTGLITGAPSTSGTFGITVVVSDPQSLTASGSFDLIVVPAAVPNQAPVLSQSLTSPINGTVGVGVSIPTAYAFSDPEGGPLSFSSPNLPASLSIDAGTGVITGAPSTSGTFGITVVVSDPQSLTASGSFDLIVVPAAVPNQAPVLSQSLTSPINGTVGVGVSIPTAYAFSDPEGGPLSFSSPNLPASLSIDAGTGLITGAPSTSGTFGITVVVSDPQSLTASGSFDLIVVPAAVPNQAPVLSQSLTSPINATVGVGVSIPTAYAFSDPEGGPLSFSSPNLPASLSIDAGTGVITGAPSTSGTFGITVVVSDPQSLTTSGSFDLIVVPAAVPNQAPVLSQSLTSPINATVGVGVSIPTAYAFSDPEGGPLSFSSPNLPASLSIDAGTGVITGAPSTSGTFGITVVASDPQSLTASGSFDLIVVPAAVPNQAPVLSQSLTSPINGTVGVGVSIPTAYAFSDPEGGPLSFSSPNLPASLSIDAGTGLITGAPSTSGTFGITVVASDPQSLTASGSFDLIVVPAAVPNQAPVLSQSLTSPINATVGVGVSIPTAYAFADPEGGPLSFSSPNLPASLSIDAGTGLITGAPSTSGTFGITVVVSDPQSLTASGSFDLIVVPAAVPNQAPVLSQSLTSPINATVGVGVSIPTAYAFSDPEGGPLSFSSPNLPASLSIDAGTGVITGAPSTSGTFGITVVVSDPQSLTASGSFDLIVVPAAVPNQAPVLSQSLTSPINGTVGVGVSIPTAYAFSDPEGGPLSFSSPNLPASLSIDAGTGVITGAPSTSGTFGITVVVSDPQSLTASGSFDLIVVPAAVPNQAPVLSQSLTSPINATVGVGVSIPTAYAFSDPEGGPLSFSSPNLPASLSIDAGTGVITGAPSTSGTFGITVVVSDPQSLTASGSFDLIVVPAAVPNQAPVLSQSLTSPINATVGVGVSIPTAYAFSDPEGGPLSFSSPNLPASLSIDAGTGVITGAPSTSGTFGITVVVSDPQSLTASGSFDLIVVPAAVPNQAPVLSQSLTSPINGTVGVGVSIPTAYAFSDPEGGPLSFSSPNLPASLSIDAGTGVITGAPSTSGTFGITVVASDPQSLTASGSFDLIVVPAAVPNQAPVLSQSLTSPINATVGVGVSIPTAYAFSDPEGGPLSFSSPNLPASLSIDAGTGVITGAPSTSGTFGITVVVSDPQSLTASGSFDLIVVPAAVPNQAPVLSQSLTSPINATVGVGVSIPTAYAFSDPEGGPLSFSSPNLPASLSIDAGTGVITGAPSTSGTFGITVVVSDPQSLTASGSFDLIVVPAAVPNQAPVLSQSLTSPINATVGVGVSIPTAYAFSDPEGGPLSFSSPNLPASLSIDAGTGLITGAPSTSGTFGITVVVSDPQSLTASGSFDLIVVPAAVPNQAPVLNNQLPDQVATVGTSFSYTIPANTFSDPESGSLTVSVTNLPPGISFNATTGVISGTPTTTTGSPFSVTVTATDPQGASVSDEFIFTINPVPNQAPVLSQSLTSPINATVGVGVSIPTAYAFSDPESQTLSFSSPNLPASLSIDAGTGVITGAPSTSGTFGITVVVSDLGGLTANGSFTLIVAPAVTPNNPPTLTGTPISSPQSATVGVAYSTTTAAAFTDTDALTFTAGPLPQGVSIDPITGIISGTPSTTVGSPFTVTVTATDTGGGSVSTTYILSVVSPAAPVCGSSNLDGTPLRATRPIFDCATLTSTGAIKFTAAGGNASGGVIEFKAIGITDWTTNCNVVIDRETRTACDASPLEIQTRQLVNGQYVMGTSYVFNIRQECPIQGCGTIQPTNRAPVVNAGIPDQTTKVGVAFDYTLPQNAFSDPDGDELLYAVSQLPAGLTFSSRRFGGTAQTEGTYPITVTAFDNNGGSVSTTFNIIVRPADGVPPTNTCGSSNLDGTPLRATRPIFDCATLTSTGAIKFTAAGGNASGGVIEFKAIGITDWTTNCNVVIDRETRTACDASPLEIQTRQLVNGQYVMGTSYVFNIRQECPIQGCGTIQPTNRAPVVNAGIPDQTTKVGVAFDYTLPQNAFSDPDGDELLYAVSQLPAGLTFSSRRFGGTAQTEGTYPITVTAFDNNGGEVSTTFNIIVQSANVVLPPSANTCGSSNLDGTPLRATRPIFDCASLTSTGAIKFTGTGGYSWGGVIEFRAVGVTDWTTNCNVIIDRETRTACDAAPIEIQIRQLVNGNYVTGMPFLFNIRQECPIQGCPAQGRQALSKTEETPLEVQVFGNPVQGETVDVEVRGAKDKALRLVMTDMQGRVVSEQTVEKANDSERQTVRIGRVSGLYLLRASTPTQTTTVKVMKQ